MHYKVNGTYKKHFELFGVNNAPLGKLDYSTWFSIKASIELHAGKKYEITPANVWQTSVHLTADGVKLASIKFNWKSQLIVSFENGATYMFKHKGIFNSHFGLFTEHDMEVVMVKPHFKLSALSFNYTIDTDDNYPEVQDPMLLLLLVYCSNYMHNMMAGGAF
ncbi:MAG: hypothetical protein V4649_15340 [Bacteroidota bacterium]